MQCTQCGYCEPVCPERIPIRACLSACNGRQEYGRIADASERAGACVRCGRCEGTCPQHIRIRDWLGRLAMPAAPLRATV